jgi:hypothetical protein
VDSISYRSTNFLEIFDRRTCFHCWRRMSHTQPQTRSGSEHLDDGRDELVIQTAPRPQRTCPTLPPQIVRRRALARRKVSRRFRRPILCPFLGRNPQERYSRCRQDDERRKGAILRQSPTRKRRVHFRFVLLLTSSNSRPRC